MDRYLPTGNEMISLPKINENTAGIEDFTYLSMAHKGLIEVRGGENTPLIVPFLQIDGEKVLLTDKTWSREHYWIPALSAKAGGHDFSLTKDDVQNLGMICGGNVTVYFHYLPAGDREILALAEDAEARFAEDQAFWLVCDLTEGGRGTELSLRAFIAKGDHVIVTASCGERIPEVLENLGAEISVLPDDPYLAPGYEKLDELFRPDTRAVVCSHGIRATGNVTDLERICAAAKQHNALVIADGSCTCGAVDVSLEILSPDVYCFSGENMLMGPEGIGGICLRQGFDGRPLQKLLEEEPAAFSDNILRSFAASLQFILDTGIYGIAMLPHRLAKRFFESAKAMDGVTVCGDYREGVRLPVVAVRAEGFTAEEISQYMKERGILIGTENDMARFSFGYFNTRPQVKETVQALMDMMGIDEPYLLP